MPIPISSDRVRRAPRYDWFQWLDGQVWEFTPGVDFHVTVQSFQSQAHNAARRQGLDHLETWQENGKLYLCARDAEPLYSGDQAI